MICCFMIVWAIDVDVIWEGCKRPVEEHKRIGLCTFIVSLRSQVIVDHLKEYLLFYQSLVSEIYSDIINDVGKL